MDGFYPARLENSAGPTELLSDGSGVLTIPREGYGLVRVRDLDGDWVSVETWEFTADPRPSVVYQPIRA